MALIFTHLLQHILSITYTGTKITHWKDWFGHICNLMFRQSFSTQKVLWSNWEFSFTTYISIQSSILNVVRYSLVCLKSYSKYQVSYLSSNKKMAIFWFFLYCNYFFCTFWPLKLFTLYNLHKTSSSQVDAMLYWTTCHKLILNNYF